MEIKVGDRLICIFNQKLPSNDYAPELELGKEYICNDIYVEKGGIQHIGVGLPLTIGYVSSYVTGEKLPSTQHWCHPNRFIVLSSGNIVVSEEEAKAY